MQDQASEGFFTSWRLRTGKPDTRPFKRLVNGFREQNGMSAVTVQAYRIRLHRDQRARDGPHFAGRDDLDHLSDRRVDVRDDGVFPIPRR